MVFPLHLQAAAVVDDLAKLLDLSEATISRELAARFASRHIYVRPELSTAFRFLRWNLCTLHHRRDRFDVARLSWGLHEFTPVLDPLPCWMLCRHTLAIFSSP